MSATNKDSDKEAERPSNDGEENPGGSKGDDGRENLDDTSDEDSDDENLDDTSDEDSDDDNPDVAEDDNGRENPDNAKDGDGRENLEDAEDDNSTENPGGSKGDGGKENPGGSKGDGGKENPGDTPGKEEKARRRKFEFASDLSNYIHKVRDEYVNFLEKPKDKNERMMGVVLYIVEQFSLRCGTKKTSRSKGSTGVCTLKKSHITLREENGKYFVFFDFIGKCGIAYKKTHPVDEGVYKILQELKEDSGSEDLFPGITATKVNDCLKKIMPKLTIRVFRTYNGSLKMQNELEKATRDVAKGTSAFVVYREALEIVAAYLNHQRAAKPQASSSVNQNSEDLSERVAALNIDDQTTPPTMKTELPEGREWNLGSSKTSYIDHRVVILWCKKNGIPIKDIYTEEDRKTYEWEIGEVKKLPEKLRKENERIEDFLYYKNI